LWLRSHRPDVFRTAGHFLFVNDFIGYRLTGQLCMNPSDAGITQLYDLASASWDPRLLEHAGLGVGKLSPLAESGTPIGRLRPDVAAQIGLSPDILVVNGAHDQYCAAVGTGVTRPGRMLLSCGTAWVILAVPASLDVALDSGLAVSPHAVPGRFGALRSLGGVGTSLEWLIDNVYGGAGLEAEQRHGLYARLNAEAGDVAPGADGVVFLPLAGGRASGYGSGQGGFMDLSLGHHRAHLARAVMEGTALTLRAAAAEMGRAGIQISELTMVGGAAKSPLWPQIVADALGVRVTIPPIRDAAARGAAILAGVGCGLFESAEAGHEAWRADDVMIEPDSANLQAYDRAYARQRYLADLSAAAGS
jgi:xylulokinase